MPTMKVREAVNLFKSGMELESVLDSVETKDNRVNENLLRNRKYSRLLDKSVLCFRICMVRMDSLIEELSSGQDEENLKQLLIKKRLLIHNQIDESNPTQTISRLKQTEVTRQLNDLRGSGLFLHCH